MTEVVNAKLAVLPATAAELVNAQQLAEKLHIAVLAVATNPKAVKDADLVLVCAEEGLSLQQTGSKAPGPVVVDFTGGQVAHRRQFGGGAGQQIAKAVGLKPGVRPRVADVTAGLGRDAFVLASLGCEVTLIERSPVIASLLRSGLERAAADPDTAPIVARMTLVEADGREWLLSQLGKPSAPQVVYVDPMFPHSRKSAAVKKEMELFRYLIGGDPDADQLLAAALAVAENRVVVKRPRKAPAIDGPEPGLVLEGKSGRFDVYPLKKLTDQ